jgi:DNA-directed RNA polymerase subunit beta
MSKSYKLIKFLKTNQNTTVNLKPIVKTGDKVKLGRGALRWLSTDKGELAIGRNLMVAFMPWKGYNFEDAIVISERIAKEDIFTSLHIDEYSLEVRDTKRGLEELTSDIPNVSEEATKELDENGLIRIGAEVNPGDILIGKITPKGETDPSPEEKLLRAIFGDKAGDVKDASLKAPPSLNGIVLDKKLFSRNIKDKKTKIDEKKVLAKIEDDYERELSKIKGILVEKLFTLVNGRASQGVENHFREVLIPKGTKFTLKILQATRIHEHQPWQLDNG